MRSNKNKLCIINVPKASDSPPEADIIVLVFLKISNIHTAISNKVIMYCSLNASIYNAWA